MDVNRGIFIGFIKGDLLKDKNSKMGNFSFQKPYVSHILARTGDRQTAVNRSRAIVYSYFFILKTHSAYLKNPLHSFTDVLGLHEQIETKIQKWRDQKLEKCERGVCRVLDPYF